MATYKPKTKNAFPTWIFMQRTAMGDYYHEIRFTSSGYMIFVNVCGPVVGSPSACVVCPTYWAAVEVLDLCRPGVRLVDRINGAENWIF